MYVKRKSYTYLCRDKGEDPSIIVRWLRRNFGERHNGWDFIFSRGNVIIEIWDDKCQVMYEMWHE